MYCSRTFRQALSRGARRSVTREINDEAGGANEFNRSMTN